MSAGAEGTDRPVRVFLLDDHEVVRWGPARRTGPRSRGGGAKGPAAGGHGT